MLTYSDDFILLEAVAEIQTKEQQILAYTIELARYRVLPGHM